ncbi:MAG: hypothetical protein BroJett030_20720 [Alphaproteobacteria bacterium]|nr:MAG: hypothetical protein BroJett030_20720 [Alphaproteobacteria bacterium]
MTRRSIWRRNAGRWAAGGALSLAVVLGVATLSGRPAWQSMSPQTALVRLSFTHSGVRNCRDRTAEELARLPPNMRSAQLCDRRRAPVRVEMEIDGRRVLAADLPPSGLVGSGPSRAYERIELPAGAHRLDLRLSDNPAADGFAYSATFDVTLAPAQSLAVDFNAASGGFFLH